MYFVSVIGWFGCKFRLIFWWLMLEIMILVVNNSMFVWVISVGSCVCLLEINVVSIIIISINRLNGNVVWLK